MTKEGLLKLGLITDTKGEQWRTWYTHGSSTGSAWTCTMWGITSVRSRPGMTFVIEPGLYIRQDALDNLTDTPENRAFKAAVAPAVAKYKNIGVRIEDSFALTDGGLKNLSASVPKTIEDVERLMAQPGTR